MINMKRTYILALSLLIAISAFAVTINDAKALYNNGEYENALKAFKELYAKNAKSAKDANINNYIGLCLYNLGEYEQAIPYFTTAQAKSIPEASKHLALIAFYNYEFEEAAEHLESYQLALTKAKKSIPDEVESFMTRTINASNMLNRVERIQVIDSINVDANDFFKFYKMSQECGSLNPTSILPKGFYASANTVVYQPESKSQMIWAVENEDSVETLVFASILTDNSWEKPVVLDENLCEGNSNYPYVMPDGVTIYFANDGENSIGGYDIFLSRKDDDGFLQPQNIGMPYNSPFNDYMLVIDETTGLGWWASDRNQIEGQVTIYTFIPNEVRKNYSSDTPNLANLARINSISDSWAEDADYSEILNRQNNLNNTVSTKNSSDFSLSLPNGDIYTSLDDFEHEEAVQVMEEYLAEVDKLKFLLQQVANLRQEYSDGNNVGAEIIKLEQQIITQRALLIRLRNNVVSLECK